MAGAAPALELFAAADIHAVAEHDVALADALADAVGASGTGSAIVTWDDPDGTDLARMTAAGLVASGRAGRARVAFHVWNDEADLDAVLRALRR
jgi:selenocysteine lyase/cysteine desulfurase